MKKSTFLFSLLLIAAMAIGQESQTLQNKITKAQASFARFVMKTEQYYKAVPPLRLDKGTSALLKNAAATQRLDSVIYEEYVGDTQSWQNLWKDEYIYDSGNRNTSWAEKEWDNTTNTWGDSSKVELEFNDAGQVSVMNIYDVDGATGELVLETRAESYYNPEGQLDSVLHLVPAEGNTWELNGSQVYHYNAQGQLVQMDFTSTEEDEEGVYTVSMRFVYTYNASGHMATSSLYFIESEMEVLFSETEYIYDDAGRLVVDEISSMNFLTLEIEPNSRTDYEYNANGDVSIETFSFYESETGNWVPEFRDEYTYSSISFDEIIFPSYLQFFGINEEATTFNYAVAQINSYENVDGEWVDYERSTFYYSDGTATSTRDISGATFSVYPNPASDNITVRWDNHGLLSLKVYHLTGAKAFERQVSSGTRVPVTSLSKGIYLYKLSEGDRTIFSGKFIKK